MNYPRQAEFQFFREPRDKATPTSPIVFSKETIITLNNNCELWPIDKLGNPANSQTETNTHSMPTIVLDATHTCMWLSHHITVLHIKYQSGTIVKPPKAELAIYICVHTAPSYVGGAGQQSSSPGGGCGHSMSL